MEKEQKLRALMQMMGPASTGTGSPSGRNSLTLYTSLLFLIVGLGGEVSFMHACSAPPGLLVLLHAQSWSS